MKLLIVIPTYNEKHNIRPLTKELFKVAPEASILFVDDNSPDGTGTIADSLAKDDARIKVLHRKNKEGLGKAYIAGFKEALKINPDYIIQMDADFSHDPRYIPALLKEIKTSDLVIGSRFMDKDAKPLNVSELSILANKYARWVLGQSTSDYLGGFKCFNRRLLEKINLDKFISNGFIFQAEFTYRAFKKDFFIKEIPIIFNRRIAGRTKKTKRIIIEAFFKTLLLKLKCR